RENLRLRRCARAPRPTRSAKRESPDPCAGPATVPLYRAWRQVYVYPQRCRVRGAFTVGAQCFAVGCSATSLSGARGFAVGCLAVLAKRWGGGSMLRVCKRTTSDPLVRAFLDNYGLNLLSIPRKNAMCGDLYIADGPRVSTPGHIAQVLIPPPV